MWWKRPSTTESIAGPLPLRPVPQRCHRFCAEQSAARYAVTSSGSAISKAASLNIQYHADVQAAVIRGAEVVRQHPPSQVKNTTRQGFL